MDTLNEQLSAWKEKANSLEKWQAKLKQLQSRLNAARKRSVELEVVLDRENEDVDRLMRLSWENLFHTLLRSKGEQLELERQQALAAALRLQETKQEISNLEREIAEVHDRLSEVHNADREYERLLKLKEAMMKEAGGASGDRLTELDAAVADLEATAKELREALDAGRTLRALLEDAANSLSKAENWGTWDLVGGGIVSTAAKHSHLDDAKNSIHRAQYRIKQFEKELKDLDLAANIHIDTDGFLGFADFFFDGLVVDWIVQGRIENSLEQVNRQIRKTQDVVDLLSRRLSERERELGKLRYERTSLIEGGH